MNKFARALLLPALFIIPVIFAASGREQTAFSSFVDEKGGISLPADFKSQWAHLGTWVATSEWAIGAEPVPLYHGTGIHNVYAQPSSLKAYCQNGSWPDGAVLVMEVSPIQWDDVPTGHVMYAADPVRWFVMVKDQKGRFKKNLNWESGWGWSLFTASDLNKNLSASAKNDCLSCHDLAKDTDYWFKNGYPALCKKR